MPGCPDPRPEPRTVSYRKTIGKLTPGTKVIAASPRTFMASRTLLTVSRSGLPAAAVVVNATEETADVVEP